MLLSLILQTTTNVEGLLFGEFCCWYTKSVHLLLGNTGVRLRAKGAAAAATKAHDQTSTAGREPHPSALEVLRGRRAFHQRGHVEDPPCTATQSSDQVTYLPLL